MLEKAKGSPAGRQKAKGKRQKAKGRCPAGLSRLVAKRHPSFAFCLLPFAFCLPAGLPFAFCLSFSGLPSAARPPVRDVALATQAKLPPELVPKAKDGKPATGPLTVALTAPAAAPVTAL